MLGGAMVEAVSGERSSSGQEFMARSCSNGCPRYRAPGSTPSAERLGKRTRAPRRPAAAVASSSAD